MKDDKEDYWVRVILIAFMMAALTGGVTEIIFGNIDYLAAANAGIVFLLILLVGLINEVGR